MPAHGGKGAEAMVYRDQLEKAIEGTPPLPPLPLLPVHSLLSPLCVP